MPSNGSQVLFEQQNGVFAIALWAEPTIWNHWLAKEVAAPVETVTVSFPQAQQEIFVFDPLLGTTPIATYTNFSDVQLAITDHPLIVETGPLPIDPTTLVVTEALANDTGSSSTDGITSDPTLKGTGAANAVVTLTIDGGAPVTTTADAAGNWVYTPQDLAEGVHTAVASETGAANIAEASLTFTLYDPPAITSVVASGASTETITTGQTIAITLGFSHPVNMAAPPLLLLNDCATASYDPTRSTATALVFDYTVGSRQRTADLTVSGIEFTPGSIMDVAGNVADLTGAGASLGLGVNTSPTGLAGPSHGFVPISGTSEVELFGPSRCRVGFQLASTGELRLDDSVEFTGKVVGLATGNFLDLADIAFGANTTLGYTPNAFNTGGTLSVTDGVNTANIALMGSYVAANLVMSNDGSGHVLITDPQHP